MFCRVRAKGKSEDNLDKEVRIKYKDRTKKKKFPPGA
jgi:hypothetical protein